MNQNNLTEAAHDQRSQVTEVPEEAFYVRVAPRKLPETASSASCLLHSEESSDGGVPAP